MPKDNKKSSRDGDKITGQKKINYGVLDGPDGKKSSGTPCYACDRKRCCNGRCGVGWMVIIGLGIAVGICVILIITGVLGFGYETDGTDTLYEELCSGCTDEPTSNPTFAPTHDPTFDPTADPTIQPTPDPTSMPTNLPTVEPTSDPTGAPTSDPTSAPTVEPTAGPTGVPTSEPTAIPTDEPTKTPTGDPSSEPTAAPTDEPTSEPTQPTYEPTSAPTEEPTVEPTANPTSPTYEPTDAPTAEPTSERRLNPETSPNVLLVIMNGTGFDDREFDYAKFETKKVDEFLEEGYTFKNLKGQFSRGSLITGKIELQTNSATWAEELRSKGYNNYYYGKWGLGSDSMQSTPLARGWDFFYGADESGGHRIMKDVQSRLRVLGDEMWSMTVRMTKQDCFHDWPIAKVDDDCRPYFVVGTDLDYRRGVACQWSRKYDEKFGQVVETLKSTELWENTVVVLVIAGELENIFSIGGGALPAKFLSRTNEDLHSVVDVVPTILAVAGFSESELESAELDGFSVIGINQDPTKAHKNM